MKYQSLVILAAAFSIHAALLAEDKFPPFVESSITLNIPTNTPGSQLDNHFVVGTNYVYNLKGQIFASAKEGHIQTTKEGFDGHTDRSTPWKTLTELLAVYQNDFSESKLRALYTESSKAAIDRIFAKPSIGEKFKAMASSVTSMEVVLEVHGTNGLLYAFVRDKYPDGDSVMPIPFSIMGDKYLISVDQTLNEACLLNINADLNRLKPGAQAP